MTAPHEPRPAPTASGGGQDPPGPPIAATATDDHARWCRWLNIAMYVAGLWLLIVMAFDWRSLRISAVLLYGVVVIPWALLWALPPRERGSTDEGGLA